MATIEIRREHGKTMKEARIAVEHVAEHIAEKFGITHAWNGDVLDFQGSGVTGTIAGETSGACQRDAGIPRIGVQGFN